MTRLASKSSRKLKHVVQECAQVSLLEFFHQVAAVGVNELSIQTILIRVMMATMIRKKLSIRKATYKPMVELLYKTWLKWPQPVGSNPTR